MPSRKPVSKKTLLETYFKDNPKKSRKDHIPISVKKAIWAKYCHPSNKHIAQCGTCESLVQIPASLNKNIKRQSENIIGIGQFGHIISEKNGGKAIDTNLIIQCLSCNSSLGSRNIEEKMLGKDQIMLESIDDSENIEFMDIENWGEKCCVITKKGIRCKNCPMDGTTVCHVHISHNN